MPGDEVLRICLWHGRHSNYTIQRWAPVCVVGGVRLWWHVCVDVPLAIQGHPQVDYSLNDCGRPSQLEHYRGWRHRHCNNIALRCMIINKWGVGQVSPRVIVHGREAITATTRTFHSPTLQQVVSG